MLCDYVELEITKAERVVAQKGMWVALCPYWAVWPFEILLLPTKHVNAISDLTKEEITDFAGIMSSITRRYDNLFETSFPYSMGIHQAPLRIPEEESFTKDVSHMHLHFYPPLLRSATVKKFLVGYVLLPRFTEDRFEMLGEPQRDLTPEQAASRLRDLSEIHYSKQVK